MRYAMAISLDVIEQRIAHLSTRLRDVLTTIPGITVSDKGARRSGIVTFTHDRVPATQIQAELRR